MPKKTPELTKEQEAIAKLTPEQEAYKARKQAERESVRRSVHAKGAGKRYAKVTKLLAQKAMNRACSKDEEKLLKALENAYDRYFLPRKKS